MNNEKSLWEKMLKWLKFMGLQEAKEVIEEAMYEKDGGRRRPKELYINLQTENAPQRKYLNMWIFPYDNFQLA